MIIKFLSLPIDEKLLLIEAIVLLFISKIIVCFPFRQYIKLLRPVGDPLKEPELVLLIKIGKSLHRANKLAFWKNICLVKSGEVYVTPRGESNFKEIFSI